MKVFVTIRALTKGIEEREVKFDPVLGAPRMVEDSAFISTYYYGNEWHHNREDAVVRAEQMRLAKIASLRKQIAKLEALSFEEGT